MRAWRPFLAIVRQPRLLGWTALAGAVIYVNWQVFILATLSGHVIETSLGYFINPIATVLLGVLVLRERLRLTQWIAIAIAGIAVIVTIVGYGTVPWVALTLAASFSIYGLIKKRIGPSVDAVSGLTLDRLGRPRAGAAGRAATRSTAAVRAAGQGLESRGTGDRLSGGSCDGQARHRQAGRQERADCALSDTREHASSLRRRPGHRPGRHRTVVPVGARASLSSERMPRCVIARHSR